MTYERLRSDVAEFANTIATLNLTGIAGVPRSGMIVASDLAVRLGLPLYSVERSGLVQLSTGTRLRGIDHPGERILVMEDSCASGRSICEAKEWAGPDCLYGAIYTTRKASQNLDLWYQELELPHWFAWNIYGNPNLMQGMQVGIDFDGILCPDFTPEDDDDGPRYIERMQSMPMLIHPGKVRLPSIITARLEKYRQPTEQWLNERGIQFDRLIMGPWKSQAERQPHCMGTWKADRIKEVGCGMFIESCPIQAEVIARLIPSFPVICPALGGSIVR